VAGSGVLRFARVNKLEDYALAERQREIDG